MMLFHTVFLIDWHHPAIISLYGYACELFEAPQMKSMVGFYGYDYA
jgi:hypothetical protein